MKIGIIGAMDEEIKILREALEAPFILGASWSTIYFRQYRQS